MKRIIALALLAGIVLAIKLLPWWASLGLIVGGGALALAVGKRLVMSFFMGAFKAKSAVLKGASARVHAITPAEPWKPDDEEDDDPFELEEPRHWVHFDLEVIVPENPETPMNFWDPSELALVGENADPDDFEADEAVGDVYGVEVMQNGAWVALDEKVSGSQRLRLHVAARPGVDRFRIRYYFELLANAI